MSNLDENTNTSEHQRLIEKALEDAERLSNTPLRRLVRKIMNEERKYLFSDQRSVQRRKNIKEFIDEARASGEDFSK